MKTNHLVSNSISDQPLKTFEDVLYLFIQDPNPLIQQNISVYSKNNLFNNNSKIIEDNHDMRLKKYLDKQMSSKFSQRANVDSQFCLDGKNILL